MTISKELFLAVLSMDADNRGCGADISNGLGVKDDNGTDLDSLGGDGSGLGTATVIRQSDTEVRTPGVDVGFYALAYETEYEIVISYRGTDEAKDVWEGWTLNRTGFAGGSNV